MNGSLADLITSGRLAEAARAAFSNGAVLLVSVFPANGRPSPAYFPPHFLVKVNKENPGAGRVRVRALFRGFSSRSAPTAQHDRGRWYRIKDTGETITDLLCTDQRLLSSMIEDDAPATKHDRGRWYRIKDTGETIIDLLCTDQRLLPSMIEDDGTESKIQGRQSLIYCVRNSAYCPA
ncbi:hypothetical protein RRG08_008312 [Elysia crispata]|uniref:Uncharacterized protein n=1 Tax=Elysia crispata TaxID=231223 RepID=A0AAE0ZMS2_9GAST|nr:hypothetical protein RRG08_008312 [Elysia crispata]